MMIDGKPYQIGTTEIPEGYEFAYRVTGARNFFIEFHGRFTDPENVYIAISDGNANGNGIWCDRIRFEPKPAHWNTSGWWMGNQFGANIKREKGAGYFAPDVTDNVRSQVSKVIGAILSDIAPNFADTAAETQQRAIVASLESKRDQALRAYDEAEKELQTACAKLCELVGLD